MSRPCCSGLNAMQPAPTRSRVSSRRSCSIQRLSIEYDGWWISSGVPSSLQDGGGLRGLLGGVVGDADVQGLAGADDGVEGAHRLLQRGVGVGAVVVEDVDVVEAHAVEGLVQRRDQVLAGAPLAVRAGPHVVAGLGGDDDLVAVGREVVGQDAAEVGLGAAGRRAVVVGQVEVGDAEVEGAAADVALAFATGGRRRSCATGRARWRAAGGRCGRRGGRSWSRSGRPRGSRSHATP